MKSWTCARCEVTVRGMTGNKLPKPEGWIEKSGELFCLACGRDLAGEAAIEAAPADAGVDFRAKARVQGRIEFELKRDPERSNGEIAKSIRSSAVAVQKARQRLLTA